ncbi:TIGR01459 family HAD-type hydrolase [Allorhizobium undicola]|uniref:TIGR01459 family HAD-type hydrolase n=1 Tax=Allorhizobium undicola TaxID=78527 RepID=UPI000487F718|nr:TIGR01459 family HAD-type hydrolase [Allorhizobium undicola]
MPQQLSTFLDASGLYDVALCDVWGVLHNGVDAFPRAGEVLSAARDKGVTVVLITNSPRPSQGVIAQLRAIGVPDSAYDRIVTSGDVTRKLIAEGPKKVFLLGPERDLPLVDGLDVAVTSADEAECIVCTGFFDDEKEVPEDYHDMLAAFVARSVPLICANPDLIVERGHRMIPCAGAIAAYYEQLGGQTRIAGKPHSPIYAAALAAAGEARGGEIDMSRVIAIGDGMPTDVRGAVAAGLDLLYISGGIHAGEYSPHGQTDEALMKAYLAGQGVKPAYWMQRLA